MEFECVWCHRAIEVDHAGWPYIQSIALLHFHTCTQRPINVTADAIQAVAARVADALETENRGMSGAP